MLVILPIFGQIACNGVWRQYENGFGPIMLLNIFLQLRWMDLFCIYNTKWWTSFLCFLTISLHMCSAILSPTSISTLSLGSPAELVGFFFGAESDKIHSTGHPIELFILFLSYVSSLASMTSKMDNISMWLCGKFTQNLFVLHWLILWRKSCDNFWIFIIPNSDLFCLTFISNGNLFRTWYQTFKCN